MKKISLYIDEQLWHRFRIECVKRKTSASQEVAGLMEQQLQQWQLEDEQRAAPSGGGCANPLAVHREDRRIQLNPGIASSTRQRRSTTPRDLSSWLRATSLPLGVRQG
jgi:hypothetical protein